MAVAEPGVSDVNTDTDVGDDGQDRPAHLRPRILRRETSQILSYYQSADAGRSESALYDCAYRSQSPDAEASDAGYRRPAYTQTDSNAASRSASPSSDYSDSDYGAPEEECGGQRETYQMGDRIGNWNRNRTAERNEDGVEGGDGDGDGDGHRDADANVQYGIALGSRSPGGDITDGKDRDGTGTGTDVGTGYGYESRITRQLQSNLHASPAHLTLLSLPPAQQSRVEQRAEQAQRAPFLPLAPALSALTTPTVAVDPAADSECEPKVAPGRRRRMSSHGASDKRRVAIVQVDSETDVSERDLDTGREPVGGALSDGFGRGEAPQAAQGQPHTQQFSISSSPVHRSPSAFSVHAAPSSSVKSGAASALLVRRGIAGTFALVAPPDASPSAYTNISYFSPPLSAPASAHPTPQLLTQHENAEATSTNTTTSSATRRQHQRSHSEAVLTGSRDTVNSANAHATWRDSASKAGGRRPSHRLRKGSRDIGIVGTNTAISPTLGTMKTDVQLRRDETEARTASALDTVPAPAAQLSPIFQTPSHSQTSLLSSDGASSTGPSGPSEQRAQSSPASKEAKRRSKQHTSNGNSNSIRTRNNGRELRSPRDENINPVAVPKPKQMWNASALSSTAYSSAVAPGGAPSVQHYVVTTQPSASASAPPAAAGTPAPAPSPYLYYQPGVHASAGPLPSPPRQIFPPACNSPPPPRPPRLHAPNYGSSSLAKRRSDTSINSKQEQAPLPAVRHPDVTSPAMTPSTTSSTLVNSQSEDFVNNKGHIREGAFPVTSVIITDATSPRLSVKQEQQTLKRKNTMDELVKDVTAAIDEATGLRLSADFADVPSQTQKESSKDHGVSERRSAMDLRREESRSTFRGGSPLPRSPSSNYSDDEYDNIGDITVTKPLPDPVVSSLPSSPRTDSREPPSRPQKIIDFALKRFSALPRPPSRLSASRASPRSSNSHERHSQERPSHEQERITPQRQKIVFVAKSRSVWPSAMHFGDVLAKKSPLERSFGYARKINELANYDPGLGDWVVTTKHNLTVPGSASKRKSMSPAAVRSPSERSFTFQPRNPSRGSIGSEMTFPKRVDAYVATDLLQKPSEDSSLPQGPPPQLPYPTLALSPPLQQQQATRFSGSSSMRSVPSSLSSSKSSSGGGGGFFASIGRKTSVKKDKPAIQGATTAQPNKLLSKRQQTVPTQTLAARPVQINAAPSLPGGPRAPPGRVQRAQSVIAPKSAAPGSAGGETETDVSRRRSIKRSPSVAPSLAWNGSSTGTETSVDMEAKVGKLADLLPHADRKILAGYLRRAGGLDMVAIGRYLDDEKNGTLIRD